MRKTTTVFDELGRICLAVCEVIGWAERALHGSSPHCSACLLDEQFARIA